MILVLDMTEDPTHSLCLGLKEIENINLSQYSKYTMRSLAD
jgi:hypothetical protein